MAFHIHITFIKLENVNLHYFILILEIILIFLPRTNIPQIIRPFHPSVLETVLCNAFQFEILFQKLSFRLELVFSHYQNFLQYSF